MTGGFLVVLLGGREIGRVDRDRRGRLTFSYDSAWRAFDGAFPLSLSLPLAAAQHAHERVDAYLWGLLPDNDRILDRWGQRFQVSARNAFGLISHVGEDCPGAVQFVPPEKLEAARAPRKLEVAWLTPRQVGERLTRLRSDHAAWRDPGDTGQFSLAGAQPKTALYFDGRRWGVPAGRTPTTHILKPTHDEFDGHIENEHLCLTLARELGIPAAGSEVRRFGSEPAIVIERYDRARTAALAAAAAAESAAAAATSAVGSATAAFQAANAAARAASLAALAKTQPVLRLHQEDVCQALGLLPTAKYQNERGPGARDVVDLLRSYSSRPDEDVGTFLDALGFSWLTAGTDAHGKNFSLLHAAGGRVRLAPLYDVASTLPYDFDPRRLRLAMKVGGEYRLWSIGARQWRKLAAELRLDADRVIERLAELATRMPDATAMARRRVTEAGLSHPLVGRLADLLIARAMECRRSLQR